MTVEGHLLAGERFTEHPKCQHPGMSRAFGGGGLSRLRWAWPSPARCVAARWCRRPPWLLGAAEASRPSRGPCEQAEGGVNGASLDLPAFCAQSSRLWRQAWRLLSYVSWRSFRRDCKWEETCGTGTENARFLLLFSNSLWPFLLSWQSQPSAAKGAWAQRVGSETAPRHTPLAVSRLRHFPEQGLGRQSAGSGCTQAVL